MLVEFSPWETTDTSLRLSISKRKRPRGGLSSSSSVCEDAFPIAGSMVTTKAGRRKQRNSPDGSRAVLAITSNYRVSVLVSKSKGSAPGAPKTEALDATDSLHESARMQYTCRPGKNASFLPDLDTEKHSALPLPKVPVLFDSKADRFWALQNHNKTLVVWDAQSEGPDSADSKRVELQGEPAHSLDFLPNGSVVGSSASGSIFYATVDNDNSSIKLCYLPSLDGKNNNKDPRIHAGTFLYVEETTNTPLTAGSKRKHSKGSDDETIVMYQVYITGCSAAIVMHGLALSGDSGVSLKRRHCREATISLAPRHTDGSLSSTVQDAMLVRTTISNPEHFLLCYKLQSGGSVSKQYCCTFHLTSASLMHPPFVVDCEPRRLALVTPRILAIGLDDEIVLCDATNGVVLHKEPLPFVLEGESQDFLLQADPRKGLLVVLFRSGEHLNVATSILRAEESNDQPPFQSTLASRLAASLGVSSSKSIESTTISPARLTLLIQPKVEDIKMVDMQFDESIRMFHEFVSPLLEKKGSSYKKGNLVEAFQRSVESLNESPIVLRNCPMETIEKPQAAVEETNGRIKKRKEAKHKFSERVNGVHHVSKSSLKNGNVDAEKKTPAFNSSSEATATDDIGALKEKIKGIQTYVSKGKENSESKSDGVNNSAGSERSDNGLPLSFVDAVTPTVVRLLVHAHEAATILKEKVPIIKADCCEVLNCLLESGNVSVRKHFEEYTGMESGIDFGGLLPCMGYKREKGCRLRSPIDFVYNVLEYCSDVSESHLVVMLHYMLCHANPGDIALAFLESKSIPNGHPHKVLSTLYMKYAAWDSDKKRDEKSALIESKVTIAGCESLLEKILSYSQCNQALLCVALRDTFSFGYETTLLCRLLSDVSFSRSSATVQELQRSKDVFKSAAQWIPALFDAFGEELGNNGSEHDQDIFAGLLKSLKMARRQTEVLIGLEEAIRQSERLLPEDDTDDGITPRKRRKTKVSDDNLAAYSVERLVL